MLAHRIVPAGVERVASEEAFDRECPSDDHASLPKRIDGVFRASRGESTPPWDRRRYPSLISLDQCDRYLFQPSCDSARPIANSMSRESRCTSTSSVFKTTIIAKGCRPTASADLAASRTFLLAAFRLTAVPSRALPMIPSAVSSPSRRLSTYSRPQLQEDLCPRANTPSNARLPLRGRTWRVN